MFKSFRETLGAALAGILLSIALVAYQSCEFVYYIQIGTLDYDGITCQSVVVNNDSLLPVSIIAVDVKFTLSQGAVVKVLGASADSDSTFMAPLLSASTHSVASAATQSKKTQEEGRRDVVIELGSEMECSFDDRKDGKCTAKLRARDGLGCGVQLVVSIAGLSEGQGVIKEISVRRGGARLVPRADESKRHRLLWFLLAYVAVSVVAIWHTNRRKIHHLHHAREIVQTNQANQTRADELSRTAPAQFPRAIDGLETGIERVCEDIVLHPHSTAAQVAHRTGMRTSDATRFLEYACRQGRIQRNHKLQMCSRAHRLSRTWFPVGQ